MHADLTQPANENVSRILHANLRMCSRVALGLALGAIGVLLVRVLTLSEALAALDQFNTTLPAATVFIASIPLLAYLGLCVAAAGVLIMKERLMHHAGTTLVINAAAMGLAVFAWGFIQYALTLPIILLMPFA